MLLQNPGPRNLLLQESLTPLPLMRFLTMTPMFSVRCCALWCFSFGTNFLSPPPDALSNGELFSLDMGLLKAANSTPISWTDVQNLNLGSDYQPVMALAQNHIHFLDVPDVPSGNAKIFVIHCEFCLGLISISSYLFPSLVPATYAPTLRQFPQYLWPSNILFRRIGGE